MKKVQFNNITTTYEGAKECEIIRQAIADGFGVLVEYLNQCTEPEYVGRTPLYDEIQSAWSTFENGTSVQDGAGLLQFYMALVNNMYRDSYTIMDEDGAVYDDTNSIIEAYKLAYIDSYVSNKRLTVFNSKRGLYVGSVEA